jgi:hypothetical protein
MTPNTIRALKTQRRRRDAGLCITCATPAVDGWHCQRCKEANAVRLRNRYRLRHGIPLDAPLWSRSPRKSHNHTKP